MAVNKTRVWTYNLTTGTLAITHSLGLTSVSIILLSGAAGTVVGDLQVGSIASTAIALQEGVPITYTAKNGSVLDGITITNSSGTIQITAQQ